MFKRSHAIELLVFTYYYAVMMSVNSLAQVFTLHNDPFCKLIFILSLCFKNKKGRGLQNHCITALKLVLHGQSNF